MENKMENNLIDDEEYKQMMDSYAEAEQQEYIKEVNLKSEWENKLQGLIPKLEILFEWLNENHDCWMPIGIVEIYDADEKRSGYSTYQHVRIKNDKDKLLYMKQDEDEEEVGVNHFCVWQTTGYIEDDYSGFLLLPLSDGKYFKVSYSC